MISDSLKKIRRNSVMTTIILACLGLVMVTCPAPYMVSLISALGALMLIASVVMVLEFIGSGTKTLMDYIKLTAALLLAIAGAVVLAYEMEAKTAIAMIRGLFLILFGLYCLNHALVFARRSGRKGWWVMVILAAILIALGIMAFAEPGSTFEQEFRITGWMVIFAALVSALRRVWLRAPNRRKEEEGA